MEESKQALVRDACGGAGMRVSMCVSVLCVFVCVCVVWCGGGVREPEIALTITPLGRRLCKHMRALVVVSRVTATTATRQALL